MSVHIKDAHDNVKAYDEADNGSVQREKLHQCPMCLKVFASGQALGGQKRFHLFRNGDTEFRENACRPVGIPQQMLVIADLLDLNLPTPPDEEVNGHSEFKSLRGSDDQKRNEMEEKGSTRVEKRKGKGDGGRGGGEGDGVEGSGSSGAGVLSCLFPRLARNIMTKKIIYTLV
ncbi:Zinc finger protein [Nymphaea thermarum]|nr:Zinc finger protein [Nymphaea thermarum]